MALGGYVTLETAEKHAKAKRRNGKKTGVIDHSPAMPLLGLDEAQRYPDRPILVVGSDRARAAGEVLYPAMAVVGWASGSDGVPHFDWVPLSGRHVTIWPTRDDRDPMAADHVAARLYTACLSVRVIDASEAPEDGWSLADALEDGWDVEYAVGWAKAHVKTWQPALDNSALSLGYDAKPMGEDPPVHTLEQIVRLQRRSTLPPDLDNLKLILDPGQPLIAARNFLRLHFCNGAGLVYEGEGITSALMPEHIENRVLYCQGGVFYTWDGSHYPAIEEETVRAMIYDFLDQCWRAGDKGDEYVKFDPTRDKVSNVMDSVRAICSLPTSFIAPAWLKNAVPDVDPEDTVVLANGLLHLPSQGVLNPTPDFWSHNAVPYNFDREAREPTEWLTFLNSVWQDDQQSIDCLQEIMGYLLTPDTSKQKIFMIVGPMRSGKGTIGHVIGALIGENNIASPTLSGLMKENSGVAAMIDKQVAIIADARLDARADQQVIAEKLLSISGEDNQTVDRKYLPPWSGKLSVRFLMMTNIMPKISDASGALASRFIVLTMKQSFLNREDEGLKKRLLLELPGILNWAVGGWVRLTARGKFVVPDSSAEAIEELRDLSSPVLAFLRDRCKIENGPQISCDFLYDEWKRWCADQARDHVGTKQSFGRELRAAVPSLKVIRPREGDGNQHRLYDGIKVIMKPSLVGYDDGM